MDLEDLEPQNKQAARKNLDSWNIEDLETYITAMEREIERARATIVAKRRVNSAGDALFRR